MPQGFNKGNSKKISRKFREFKKNWANSNNVAGNTEEIFKQTKSIFKEISGRVVEKISKTIADAIL